MTHNARHLLMMSCATAALATAALLPRPANAQAFQGNITSSTGGVVRSPTSGTSETLTIGSDRAVINWSPTNQQQGGGTIDFLPNGNVATFTSSPGVADYTVLNRITPSTGQPIALNGHVISTLQGTSATGGHVWFYSPGGIVVGATAVFDVGGLLLTTNDVTSFGTTSTGFSATFGGASTTIGSSKIQILSGARINALQQNSYVALIAPRIEQGGKVRVNGSAAYAAGEQLSMTLNQGLFDISIDVGTSDPNGIVHTGETSGPGNATGISSGNIYMVAVPKNDALTMLLSGGTVGFDQATSAQVQNGQIILSSGQGVSGTAFAGQALGGAIGGAASGITISGGHYTSTVTARGTGEVQANGGGGTLTFDHDVNLQGLQGASLLAFEGDTINVHGNARVSADDLRFFDTSNPELGLDATGGFAEIGANSGGSITIDGTATVTADASPATNSSTLVGGRSFGGTALIDADGGAISIGGATSVSATGFGDGVSHAGIDGRDSTGGEAEVFASSGGTLHIGGALSLMAEGHGSASALVSGGTGGTGSGGTATISADDHSAISVGGTTRVSASGIGGGLLTSTDGTGGEGDGGSIDVAASFGGNITFGADADFLANGIGQTAQAQGGDGYGGNASLFLDGGTITANGHLATFADGLGGSGLIAGDGYGGSVFGGFTGGEGFGLGGTLNVAGDFRLQAGGHGGNGLDNAGGAGGQGGNGYGGSAIFYVSPDQVEGSPLSVNLADVFVTANGEGGAGGNGLTGGNGGSGYSYGFFDGGEGSFFGDARIEIWAGNVTARDMQVFSTARGGNGGSGSAGAGGDGGDAFGGSSTLTVGGNLTATRALSYDRALAGNGGSGSTSGNGGQANGGDASIDVVDGGHLTGAVDIATNATGGTGNNGGSAQGGSSTLTVEGLLSGSDITIASAALGGNGVIEGGDASGGSAIFEVFGGTATFSGAGVLDASATGGSASNGTGGFASGGEADAESAAGGSIAGGDLTANASGTGGNGRNSGGAIGGSVGISATSAGSGEPTAMSFGHLDLLANGTVGAGNPGGESGGSGGDVSIQASGGTINANALAIQANGSNFGGMIDLEADPGFDGLKGAMHFGGVNATANGEDNAGFIQVATGMGSAIDLGSATLTTSGGFGGNIFLLAGECAACGGGAGQSPALPAGGGIAAQDLTLNSTGNIFMGLSGGADIAVSGTLRGDAGQTISMVDDGSGGVIRAHEIDLTAILINDSADILADIIKFTSSGTMNLGNLSATDSMTLTTGGDLITGDLTAGNLLSLNAGQNAETGDLSGQNIKLNARGDATVGDVHAGGTSSFSAGGNLLTGDIAGGAFTLAATDVHTGDVNVQSLKLTASGDAKVGNVGTSGDANLSAGADLLTGNVLAGGALTLAAGHDIATGNLGGQAVAVNAQQNATLGNVQASTTANLAAGANLLTGNVTAGNSLSLAAGGDATAGNLAAPTVTMTAGGKTTVHDVHASTSAAFTAGGLASFTGTVNSPTITVTSGDIDIAEGAALGVFGVTNLITLNAVSSGLPIIIGNGPAADGQYHLNEDGDIRSASLVINAVGKAPGITPDVQVFDATIDGSTTSGGGFSNVTLNTGGSVFVKGHVLFGNAGASDKLTINAGHNLEVNTDTGGIVITDSSGHLAGILDLNAANIWVGSGSLLSQLEADPNFAGRDAALANNSGTANQDGFIRAGTINAGVANSFFVQNSGTPDLFAGIDTGAGGLAITNTGNTQALVVIFGRQTTASGTVVTNQDFLGTVGLAGTGGFTNDSAVNGCIIGSLCGQPPATPGIDMASILGPLDQTDSPSDEDKKKKDKDNEEGDSSTVDPQLRLINTTPINLDHTIDEPVTSGGDLVIGGAAVQPN